MTEAAQSGINKRYSEMTDQELLDALDWWSMKIRFATSWGAAYGMAYKESKKAKAEAIRRGLKEDIK